MAETFKIPPSELGMSPKETTPVVEKPKKVAKKIGEVIPLVRKTQTRGHLSPEAARGRFEELRKQRTGEAGKKRTTKVEAQNLEPQSPMEEQVVTPSAEKETFEARTLRQIKERAAILEKGSGEEAQKLREEAEKERAAQAARYKEAERKKKTEDLFDKTMDSIIIDQQYKDLLARDASFGSVFVKKDLGLLRTSISKTVDDLEKKLDLTPEGKVKGWDLFGFKRRKMEKTEDYKRYQAYREMQEALIVKVAKAGAKVAAKKERFFNEAEQRSKWVVR